MRHQKEKFVNGNILTLTLNAKKIFFEFLFIFKKWEIGVNYKCKEHIFNFCFDKNDIFMKEK